MPEFIAVAAVLVIGSAVAWTVTTLVMLARALGDMEDVWGDDDW